MRLDWPEETPEYLARQQAVESNGNTGAHYDEVAEVSSNSQEDLSNRGNNERSENSTITTTTPGEV